MARRYRLFHTGVVFIGLIGNFSCADSATAPVSDKSKVNPYFSLEDFFIGETSRLTKLVSAVEKKVSRNGISEEKHVQIDDWKNELALFIDSDINKPAWQTSYRIDSTRLSLSYTSIDPELRTQKITIDKYESGQVKHIAITNRVSNMLYQTTEQLDYYPDSLYQINKQQQVRFIGNSQYLISGHLK